MRATTSTALLAALTGSASAHMMLSYPAPLNSKYNPFADSGKIDYSYTAPLAADGSDYPCKGYQSDLGTSAGQATASFAIGGQGNITVVGGAAHGGGSCQISLSTDGAKTFTVIQSIVGNCPVNGEGNFDFTVPSDAPAGDAVLAWSWNNRIGNREFYMNCAAVTLTGGSAKREATDKRGVAFSSRPQIFVANIGNGCNVAEGGDVNYPNPGPDVTNNSDNPEAPTGNCGSTGSSSGSGSSDSGSAASSSSSSVAEATPSSSALGGIFATVSASVEVPAATQASTTLSTVTSATPTPTPDTATPTTAASAGEASGTTTSGATAAGSACTNEGEWNCISGSSFQRCASGTWSAVQSLAAGTACEAGVAANLKMITARKPGRFHKRRIAA
ncbi:spore coat protein sp96 precursor [Diaporthe amygdali]|uniref:spore coat protein sp96 precursor n=1 Tax=Phomopsis amygdali TaxID=1214568 RepID=UPI0022FF1183|nr:spore coat protein sp96 precursor [Diaporthe amygdali]KAJ0124612.1 spore coat protein sp96 precursor [Diaporthe amygdali]